MCTHNYGFNSALWHRYVAKSKAFYFCNKEENVLITNMVKNSHIL